MKKQILFITIALLAVSLHAAITGTASAQTFYGPTAYLKTSDSPFDGLSFGDFYLEDFEDESLNTPGLSVNAGVLTSDSPYPDLIDSVDEDDGAVDGSGSDGESWFRSSGSAGLTFTFDAAVLGSLPTHAGIVWTDGGGTTTFEAFDESGASLGTIGPFLIADTLHTGETDEDRFFGVSDPAGIWKIHISNSSGGIEVDHIQYGIDGTEEEEVDIPDPGLEAAIREALGISETDLITVADLEGLTFLDASGRGIKNLTGLKHCKNLEKLELGYNPTKNINALSGLTNLEWLDLHLNDISDISALSGLTNLERLNLNGNNIRDISALSGLSDLELLYLSGNSISDIIPLSGLTDLVWLDLNGNDIRDISALSGLSDLVLLYLNGNSISDIIPLSGLTDLVWLDLRVNDIQIIPLSGLTNLEVLRLGHNNISHIGTLVANPGINAGDYVSLRANPLSDQAIDTDIPTLQDRGVHVDIYPPVGNLIAAVEGIYISTDLPRGTYKSLIAHLKAAERALDKANEVTAIKHLSTFIDQCERVRGTKLEEEDADYLILYAEDMIEAIRF
ncbi:MAG: hypothetical protein CEE38_16085 [Planctomycetes bacterium B3_Pla]|nr:MAG: hypothetical protein CEE38_16085 [Planctomycetes bacterium B3_Pla]